MNNKSNLSTLNWKRPLKSFLKFNLPLKRSSRSITLKDRNGRIVKLISRITWPWVKANIMRCKRPWMNWSLRVELKLKGFNSSFRMLKNFPDKERKSLKLQLKKKKKNWRISRICLRKNLQSSSKSLNSKKSKINNLSLNSMKAERLMIKWLRPLRTELKKAMMVESMLKNKWRILRKLITKRLGNLLLIMNNLESSLKNSLNSSQKRIMTLS